MYTTRRKALVIAIALGCIVARAQTAAAYSEVVRYKTTGAVDFRSGLGGSSAHDAARCLGLYGQQIVEGGQFFDASANRFHLIVGRFNADGSVDTSFGYGGVTTAQFDTEAQFETVKSLVVDPATGQITVLGLSSDDVDGSFQTFLMRFNKNGAFDTAFGKRTPFVKPCEFDPSKLCPDGTVPESLKRKSDGTIVALATDAELSSGGTFFKVARLDTKGKTIGSIIRGNFSTEAPGTTAYDVAINNTSGKIVVVGQTPPINGRQLIGIVRYTSTGALDSSFGSGGKKTINIQIFADSQRATGVAYDANNRIIVVGRPDSPSDDNQGAVIYVARLADGVKDQLTLTAISNTTAVAANMPTWRVAVSGNDFFISGNAHLVSGYEAMATVKFLGSSFAVDTNFGTSGHVITGVFAANEISMDIAVGSDGKPVVAGHVD